MALNLWRRALLTSLRSITAESQGIGHLLEIGAAEPRAAYAAAVSLQHGRLFRGTQLARSVQQPVQAELAAVPQQGAAAAQADTPIEPQSAAKAESRLASRPSRQGMQRDLVVPVYNMERQAVGEVVLPGDVFDVPIRRDILHRVVRWQLAKRQQGSHKTKTRSEVAGGGRKPWQQKGSGKARAGSIRAPQFRGGGIVHGPVVRSHAHKMFKKVRRLGLKTALSAKTYEQRLLVVDSMSLEAAKTRVLDGYLDRLLDGAPRRSVLLVDTAKDGPDGGDSLRRASRNLQWVDVVPQLGSNVYSILRRDYLIMTRAAVEQVVERMRTPIKR